MLRTQAWKRYNWRVVWLSLLYAAFLIAAVYGFKHELVPRSVRYLVAILPALLSSASSSRSGVISWRSRTNMSACSW